MDDTVSTERSVYFVDDDEDILLLWRLLVTDHLELGRMEFFANPFRAIERIEVAEPALLVTDVSMPGMTGLELLTIVISRFPTVAVIVTSAVSEVAEQAMRSGAIAFLDKSAEATERLPAMLAEILDLRDQHSHT